MLIEYKNVNFSHKDDDFVLHEVNFTVSEGEFIYIIGKVGSGKSSLLRTFYGDMELDTADKAEVLGRDMTDIRRKEIQKLRREMGIIFQDFQLLTDRTVKKNLEFVLKATGWKDKSEIAERIEEVLKSVGMTGVEDKMPHELSGGEQQRIAIARSLLNSPKIILADEPTGNLDPETADQIIGLFNDIASKGTAVVMTTHNLPMLERFPGRVFQCDDQHLMELTELCKV
ncbi:MAG: ATP-binding cassette domain-containing protein [Prevotella sp.]|nr:ATP-binding cassette domain-containing protein [Prevotella sp.]MBR4651015.1 ATP-binding cassette domain-containing protein [Prevotella sp.]